MTPRPVPAELDGERLDLVISRLGGMGRAAARRLVEKGGVRVNGQVATAPAARMTRSDTVEYAAPPPDPVLEPEPIDFDVAWEDESLAIVDKPAGLVTHPGAGNPAGTLAAGLLYRWPGIEGVGSPGRWGIVHRLDKGTSGLLVVAKQPRALEKLQDMLRSRRVERRYLALVQEPFDIETGTVDAPIDRDPGRPLRRRVSPTGRPARTHFDQQARWAHHGLLEVRLETGRTHQIRVHMTAIGHPVVGDRVYGASGGDPADPGRPWLHSWKLAFEHPLTGELIDAGAPVPEDLQRSLLTLGEPAAGSIH